MYSEKNIKKRVNILSDVRRGQNEVSGDRRLRTGDSAPPGRCRLVLVLVARGLWTEWTLATAVSVLPRAARRSSARPPPRRPRPACGRRRARGPTPTRGARPPAERLQSERKSSKCPRRSLSADGARVGTPGCAAPTRGARVPDVRSKVHSLQYTYGPTTPTHDG